MFRVKCLLRKASGREPERARRRRRAARGGAVLNKVSPGAPSRTAQAAPKGHRPTRGAPEVARLRGHQPGRGARAGLRPGLPCLPGLLMLALGCVFPPCPVLLRPSSLRGLPGISPLGTLLPSFRRLFRPCWGSLLLLLLPLLQAQNDAPLCLSPFLSSLALFEVFPVGG